MLINTDRKNLPMGGSFCYVRIVAVIFLYYFRKPLTICSSASASVKPRVISLMI